MRVVGGCWKRKNKEGKSFLSGSVEIIPGLHTNILIAPVEEKKNPKGPDYVVKMGDSVVKQKPEGDHALQVKEEDIF